MPCVQTKFEYNNVVIKDTRLTLDQIEGRTVDLELVIDRQIKTIFIKI